MKQYYNWEGSRKDLIALIVSFEKKDPKKYKMYSKKYKDYLSVTLRRLQQFTDKGILPNGEIINNSYMYNSEHLFRYFAAIKLKNSGHTLIQVEKILKELHHNEVIENILELEKTSSKNNNNDSNFFISKSELPERLKKLGRDEGRVLRSQWLKLAITRWCHLDIKKKDLKKINLEEIETIALAVKETLLVTSKIENIDRSIG